MHDTCGDLGKTNFFTAIIRSLALLWLVDFRAPIPGSEPPRMAVGIGGSVCKISNCAFMTRHAFLLTGANQES